MGVWVFCVENVVFIWRLIRLRGQQPLTYLVQVSREYFGGSNRIPGVM